MDHNLPQNYSTAERHTDVSLGLGDAVVLTLMVGLYLFASWFRSKGNIFWSDEIMGWLVLRQDTWSNLIHTWWAGIDSSGIFFYLFGRPWLALFGASELSIRLFSGFGMAIAFVLTWLTARRYIRVEIVAAVLPIVFFLNRTALWQLANGRTYGVMMTAIALNSYAMIRTSPEDPASGGGWTLALTSLASVLLVGSHILGILYWGVFLAGFLVRDLWFRVFRPRLYLTQLSGLAILLLSWRNIASTAALGKPTFWTPRPTIRDLQLAVGDYSLKTLDLLLVALLAFAVTILVVRWRGRRESVLLRSRASFYCLLGVFPALILVMFVVSRVTTSIFFDRYLLPILIGDALLICEFASRVAIMARLRRPAVVALACLAGLAFVGIYRDDLRFAAHYPQTDYTPSLLAKLPPGEPIVLTDDGAFVEMVFYHNKDRQFLNPIDWAIQLDPDFGPGGASGLHEMENWKATGLYADHIQPTQQILQGNRRFLVVSDPDHTLWFRRYIAMNAKYREVELPPSPGGLRIWQVEVR